VWPRYLANSRRKHSLELTHSSSFFCWATPEKRPEPRSEVLFDGKAVQEICYFLEGDVVETPDGENHIEMGKGNLVTFPEGMSCSWNIRKNVTKHYKFG